MADTESAYSAVIRQHFDFLDWTGAAQKGILFYDVTDHTMLPSSGRTVHLVHSERYIQPCSALESQAGIPVSKDMAALY